MEKPFQYPAHKESSLFLYDITCQYAAVDVETAKVIVAEVIVCYLGMLCKWNIAVLVWIIVFQLQFELFIDVLRGGGGTRKLTWEIGFVRYTW